MKKTTKIILGFVTVSLVGLVVYGVTVGKKVSYETEAIERGKIVSEVSVTGSLEPAARVSLEPEVSGRVDKIAVKEGDIVKEGSVLVTLDARDLQSRLASARASVAAAKAQLAQLVAGATPEDLALSQRSVDAAVARVDAARQAKVDADASLVNAEASRQNTFAKNQVQLDAKVDAMLDDYTEAATSATDAVYRLDSPLYTTEDRLTFTTSSSQAEIDAATTRLEAKSAVEALHDRVTTARAAGTKEAAEAAYAASLADLRRVKAHLDKSAAVLTYSPTLATAVASGYQLNVSTAQSAVAAAIDKLVADKTALDVQVKLNAAEATAADIAVTGARTAVNAAASGIVTAERSLAEAKASLDLKKSGARKEAVAAQRANVAAAEATVTGLINDLSKRTITAPMDAVVTDVAVKRGETVMPGKAAVSLNAQGRFEIVSNVSEVDIARVKVGQPVGITLDAFSADQAWTGTVSRINPAEKVVEGVIFYETRVLFDQDDARLKSGMTANLVIETDRREGVLRLPLRAVKEADGKKTVRVLVAGQPQERVVTLGLQNNEYVEVTEGVAEGDAVITGEGK